MSLARRIVVCVALYAVFAVLFSIVFKVFVFLYWKLTLY